MKFTTMTAPARRAARAARHLGAGHELVSSVAGTETWRAKYPLASAARIFFRLKVTQP
jgi:hypothetical protein